MRRKIYLLLTTVLMICVVMVQAQIRSFKGTVVSNGFEPVANATVTVKGTTRATQTDTKGNFTIQAAPGEVLIFTSIGFGSREYTVSENLNPRITMNATDAQMQEVVVTALDIKRNPRELGYSVQRVGGDDIRESQRENFINGLAGRVAGLTINPTSGVAGASSSIVLRGFNSLSQSNQPLFIVDGVIMDNQTVDENSDGGRGIGTAGDMVGRPNSGNANRNSDYTNRIADLNPNDIESITVLKGPEATALYGSQASSGALIISTRKARSNKLAIQYDNSFRFQKVTRFPRTYEAYENGRNGVNSNVYQYFGQPYPPTTDLFNNIGVFFRTGFAQTHNLGMDFGVKNSIFRVSGSIFDQEGVIPNNQFQRYNARISNTTKIGKWLDLMPAFSIVRSENDKVLRSGGGYLNSLLIWPNEVSILDYQTESGSKLPLFNSNPNADYDNPLFSVYNNQSRDVTDRYLATLGINVRPFEWLSLTGRFGYDHYKTDGYTVYHPQSYFIGIALKGSQDNYYRRYNGYNHTITATARKKFGDFNFRLMGGTMWQDYQTKMFAVSGNNLADFRRNDSNNSNPATRVRLLRNNFGEYNRNILRQIAYFGEFAVNWKNMLFLSYTHRFETASTLPVKNRHFNYPGASFSAIMSDLIPVLKRSDLLNYWKIRASLASTARLNSPYSTQSVFVNNFAPGGGYSYGFTNANPDLIPEKQQTYEIGTEFRLFHNRLNIDASYYNTLNKDQIIENFRLSYGTGYVLNTQNAASTRNTGVEIALDAQIIAAKKFGWNARINFNKMWNKVIKMPANLTEFYIADTWVYGNARGGIVLNGPSTSITANGYARNTAGQILIDPTSGLPFIDGNFKVYGDRNPDFTMGIQNSFRYGNWRLSFLLDLKVGGDIFNGTELFLTRSGRSLSTKDRFEPRIVEGVLKDGKENTTTPTINTISIIPAYNDLYYVGAGTATSNDLRGLPEEAFIEKNINWIRLRDITLNYGFGNRPIRGWQGLKNLELFLTGNDLFLITNYTGADPAVSGATAGTKGVGAFGFDYGTLSTPVSVTFGLRAGF